MFFLSQGNLDLPAIGIRSRLFCFNQYKKEELNDNGGFETDEKAGKILKQILPPISKIDLDTAEIVEID